MLSQLRYLYNESLAERKEAWEKHKESVSLYDQCKTLTRRREDSEWSRYPVRAQRSVLRRLDRAYKHFFKRGGYPRFKSWRRGIRSFELDQVPKIDHNGNMYSVVIKGVGRFKFKPPLLEGEIKLLRVVKSPRRVKVQFVVELPDPGVLDIREAVGVDMGIKSRVVLSTGYKVPKRVVDREELKRKQRILSRSVRGSKGRDKKRVSLAKEWDKVRERERGVLHELTADLVKHHSAKFVVEDLKIPNMVRNKHLSRSIIEQQWGAFVAYLTYKAESAGGWVRKVDPRNTTQQCSSCGAMPEYSIGLGDRWYDCYSCRLSLDRDVNAARNILSKGLSLGLAGTVAEVQGDLPAAQDAAQAGEKHSGPSAEDPTAQKNIPVS